ncbi:MAG: ribosome maturation factor RimM [Bacilli bacterium]|nr:ribosome maturation factor RimM [Bacilli bacterium]
MNYIYIGNIVNTHGIKGEIRILSKFQYKNLIFKKNFKIYIGSNYDEEIINTYRVHKNYDMITLNNINNINEVLKYKGKKVYINKDDIKIDGYFDEDLIGLLVYTDKLIGKVKSIEKLPHQDLIIVENDKKRYLIPKVTLFIKEVDLQNNKIVINNIEGLIDEN